MTEQPAPGPVPPDALQFDQAEPVSAAAPPSPLTCAACGQTISDAYYEGAGKVICGECAERARAAPTGGSGLGRFVRALVFGTLAAALGAVLYFGIAVLTGYEIG